MHVYYLDLRRETEDIVDQEAGRSAADAAGGDQQCAWCCEACGCCDDPEPLKVDGFVLRCPKNTWAPAGWAVAMREDFIDVFREHLRGCHIGICMNTTTGEPCPGYVSCYMSQHWTKRLVLRGGPKSTYGACDQCGFVRMQYVQGRGYYLKHQFDAGRHVYGMGFTFLITEDFAATVDWSRFPDIDLYRYPVLDRPRDGQRLPGDPDWDAA